jgi:hypothetical protein
MLAPTLDARVDPARTSGPWPRVNRREACLRPEHARLYPGIRAGEWQSAAVLADRVLAHHLLYGLDTGLPTRDLLDGTHFEFRGGEIESGGRSQREDRG